MPDNSTSELIGGLNLIGTSGNFCAILTEQQITLERIDGKGIRLDLSAIDRMRHLKAPMLPAGTIFLGLILVYLGFTTVVQPINIFSILAGMVVISMNLISRYSILAVETNAGDRHLISGTEGNLLKLCMMIERIRHGSSMDEARIGLEGLETEIPTFPALQDAKGLLGIGEYGHTEFNGIKSEILNYPEEINDIRENYHQPVIDKANDEPEFSLMTIDDSISEQSGLSAYEKAWGQPAPSWYSERNISDMNNDRLGSAASEAAESLDLFADGGIFDDSPIDTKKGEIVSDFQNEYEGNNSPSSSAQMIKDAFSKYGEPAVAYVNDLPPPTEIAVRDDCKAGIVKQALAKKELNNANKSREANKINSLIGYPGINKLASSMNLGKATSVDRKNVTKPSSWIGRLLGSGANSYNNNPKQKDVYREILNNKNNRNRFQSSQHIRLRSDQEHQAQLGNRGLGMNVNSNNTQGQKALGEIVSQVSGIRNTKDHAELGNNQFRFSDLRATSSEDDPHPLPGLKRLG